LLALSRPSSTPHALSRGGPALCSGAQPSSQKCTAQLATATHGLARKRPAAQPHTPLSPHPDRNLGLGREMLNPPEPKPARLFLAVGSNPTAILHFRSIKTGVSLLPVTVTLEVHFLLRFLSSPPQRHSGGGLRVRAPVRKSAVAPLLFPFFSASPPSVAITHGNNSHQRSNDPALRRRTGGGAAAAPFVGARVRPEPRAVPSSGPAVVPCRRSLWLRYCFLIPSPWLGFLSHTRRRELLPARRRW
jgi:hypothetical protein